MTQYFLWAIPDGEAYEQYGELIRRLGQQYQGPLFEPHVTVLGGIEGEEAGIVDQVRMLAEKISPLSIELQQSAYDTEYFRCVYFHVKETPALLAANLQAQVLFGKNPVSPFQPHLSVMYGEIPNGIQQEVLKALPANLPHTFLSSTLALIRAETLNPEQWSVVEKVGFSSR
jgi:2'-5' RNA ligase